MYLLYNDYIKKAKLTTLNTTSPVYTGWFFTDNKTPPQNSRGVFTIYAKSINSIYEIQLALYKSITL